MPPKSQEKGNAKKKMPACISPLPTIFEGACVSEAAHEGRSTGAAAVGSAENDGAAVVDAAPFGLFRIYSRDCAQSMECLSAFVASCDRSFAIAVDFPVDIARVHAGGHSAAYAIDKYLDKVPFIRAQFCRTTSEAEHVYVDRARAYMRSKEIGYDIPSAPRTIFWS